MRIFHRREDAEKVAETAKEEMYASGLVLRPETTSETELRHDSQTSIERMKAERDIDGLIRALKDSDTFISYLASTALGELGDDRAVEPLTEMLHHHAEPDCRHAAAKSLAAIGNPRAIEPLVSALDDSNYQVRFGVAEDLGKFGSAAVEPLLTALTDPNANMRIGAARALAAIGDSRTVIPLARALTDEYVDVRLAAGEALQKFGDERAVEFLTADLNDERTDVCELAASALVEIKSRGGGGV
jgi:HEAT repeat protein